LNTADARERLTDVPSGTVTLLFTDLEGSTRLLQQLGDNYAAVLADVQAILRGAFAHWYGREVDTQGDSFFVAFGRASDAINSAVEAQRTLAAHKWPPGATVKVRMGLHTGEPQLGPAGYVGLDVHRAARIAAAAHGGQVLLSQTSHDLLSDGDLPDGVSLRDLGEHRLKDLRRTRRLFQLIIAGLSADFPPLKSLDVLRHNLPIQLTSFVARERELVAVKNLLASARLLTLSGVGGTGKTRLALQVAAECVDRFGDGVWLVELATLSDPALVPYAVASVLAVRDVSGRDMQTALLDILRPQRLLLIVDNCEHVIDICAPLIDTLLRNCPHVRVLATSREILGVPGETVWPVPTLPAPNPRDLPAAAAARLEAVAASDAARLFVERAQDTVSAFRLTPDNAADVAEICYRLDGIPLAIELAAARLRTLTAAQLAARLDDRFSLLTGGNRTAPSRHQTLRAVVDWSYEALSELEQGLFRSLSVFAGGWTLEAAEAVSGEPGFAVLDRLGSLVDKSLVLADAGASGTERFRLLETLREYVREKLDASGEAANTQRRHADYYLALAMRSDTRGDFLESLVRRRDFRQGLVRVGLVVEYDNFRAALRWFSEVRDWEGCLHLIGALSHDWLAYGYLFDPAPWIDLILEHKDEVSPLTRGLALRGAGLMALARGDHLTALAAFQESLAIYTAVGDGFGVAISLADLALAHLSEDELTPAAAVLEQALQESRSLGDDGLILLCLQQLVRIARLKGDLARAEHIGAEVLETLTRSGKGQGMRGETTFLLGEVAEDQGQLSGAIERYRGGIALLWQGGYRRTLPLAFEAYARVASHARHFERAAVLAGAAAAMRERLASPIPPIEKMRLDQALLAAREQLAEGVVAAAWEFGKAMSWDQAIACALEEDDG
jgi:predicted ATPase/class 3 adenylate cyclase